MLLLLKRSLLFIATVVLMACGGGGDDATVPIAMVPQSEQLQASLKGPWPDSRLYYAVIDAQMWASIWEERRLFLGCTDNPSQSVCGTVAPPTIDFSSVILIGVNLGRKGLFTNRENPIEVFKTSSEIIVEYGYIGLDAPAQEASSAFGLLPRTALSITFRAKP